MSELIVLGLIPGAQIRITFVLWMVLMFALTVTVLAWAAHRTHAFRNWMVTIHLLLLTRQRPEALR